MGLTGPIYTGTFAFSIGQTKHYFTYFFLKFGFGEVIKMEGAAYNPVAMVKFEYNGEKKIRVELC